MTDEGDDMQGPRIEEIVGEVVAAEDLKDAVSGLEDVAKMAGAYYRALAEQGMPKGLVHDLVLQWADSTLNGGDGEPA